MAEYVVDGFVFKSQEDADRAYEEQQKVQYIASKLDMNRPEAVLTIYQRITKGNMFYTPVGLEYVRELQSYLYKSQAVLDDQIPDIVLPINYTEAIRVKEAEAEDTVRRVRKTELQGAKTKKDYKQDYKYSVIVNVILAVTIIALFIVALKSDNLNIINYRTRLQNEYASWEEQLSQREEAVREKEKELIEQGR